MIPNLGTKGNGEPVVQPAERYGVTAAHWIAPIQQKLLGLALMVLAAITLTACSSNQSQVGIEVTPQAVPYVGGQVNLSWNIEGAQFYTVRSEPPLPGLPFVTRSSSARIQLESNQSPNPKSYQVIIEANTPKGLERIVINLRVEGKAVCSSSIKSQAQLPAAKSVLKATGLGHFDVPHVAGRLIVYSKNRISLQSHIASAQSLGAQWARDLGGGWNLYRTQPGQEAKVAQSLYQHGLGQYVQPEYLYQPDSLAVPPHNRSYQLEQAAVFGLMNIEQAWQKLGAVKPGCDAPVVAVVDTGFYTQRGDLAPNLTPQNSWLDVVGDEIENPRPVRGAVEPKPGTGANHGTQVASIIAATTNDGSALAGTAYNLLRVLPIKVFDAKRQAGTLQVAQALEYAAGATQIAGQVFINPTPAQVVNLSLSISKPGFRDPYLEQVLEQVTQQGVVVVASSGNADQPSVGYPASSPFVIAVGAADASLARARWFSGYGSNYGSELEFVAPGSGVPVAHGPSKDDYALAYGTSASAPFISSAIGLYLLQQQQLGKSHTDRLAQVRNCLKSAGQNASAWNSQTGYGLVDLAKVVDPNNAACFPKE